MADHVKPTLSTKNPYWISRHRYYELKHFCLQYPEWRKAYLALEDMSKAAAVKIERESSTNEYSDPTAKFALRMTEYSKKMKLIEDLVIEADEDLSDYIFKAVTEGRSYSYLKAKLEIPCGRDMFYDRCRRFYWLLSKER